MVLGLDRREVVQDPNKGTKAEMQQAPLPAIMRPQPSSFNEVGKTGWEDAISSASKLIENYQQKKQDEDLVNGKMWMAQGKSEKELYDTGNRFTIAGYEMIKSHTAMEVFNQQMQQDIIDHAHTQDPDTFRAGLSSKFSEIADKFKSSDPLVKDALLSQVEQVFPSLVAMQVKANNMYRKEQHVNSFENALSVAAKPEDVKTVLSTMGSELPVADRTKSIANVAERASKEGNLTLIQSLAGMNGNPIVNPDPTALLHVIGKGESGGNYNAVYGGKEEPTLSSMTVDQVLAYQDKLKTAGADSTAVGKYQFLNKTLSGLKDKLKLTGSEVFDGTLQDKLALAKLQERGFNDYVAGKLPANSFIAEISKEWAALPKDATGKGQYDSDGINKANIHYGELQLALSADVVGNQAKQTMIDSGFAPTDVSRVITAYKDAQTANSNKWDTDRIMMEDSISNSARLKGNLQESLQQITKAKEQFGLSDAWANQQANQVQSEIAKYTAEKQKMQEVDLAISKGTAGALSSEKQQLAVDRMQLQLAQQFPAANMKDNPNYAHDRAALMDQTFKFMYKNNITDKRLTQKWETAIMGDIVDAKGLVKQPALEAYGDYRQAIQSTSNKPWVTSQMSSKTQDVFMLADSYMNAGNTYSAEEALVAAQAALTTKLPEGKKHTISSSELSKTTKDMVDTIVPNVMSFWGVGDSQAQYRWQISEDSVQKAVKDPAILNRISSEAAKFLDASTLDDPNTAKALAFEKAKNKTIAKTEYIAGSLVYTGDDKTISQQIGSDRANEANRVVGEYLAAIGPSIWKDWNKTDLIPHSQTWYADEHQNAVQKGVQWIKDAAGSVNMKDNGIVDTVTDKAYEKLKGIQDTKVIYNPTSKALVVWPYRNYQRTATLEPLIIPLETLKTANDLLKLKDRTKFDAFIQEQIKSRGR
jgi:muramidase (phage lysozyme)